ncbi:hypothetical protein QTO34_016786 [Cnephaeus nilssonii]|uniref:Peptidase A2 domain-containing protein n=1 Tax=Cnephaeus nilssonii TaxID=3371016 RepID=A0AA40I2W4_CNENI|nr:hypothetical protein QTO34_016786 [Eptesicus nilssonii]
MVEMKIKGQTVNFMVDTGAEHSAVTQKVAPLSGQQVTIIRATRDHTRRSFCCPCQCQLGGHQVVHEFLYLPDCSVPLMGRELLAKMGAEITFAPDSSAQLHLGEETSPMILSLTWCQSPWNTPLLPVKKPGTNDYYLVQDLRAVNEAIITLYSVLLNPYTLLGLILSEAEWLTCLDLKDAFSCLQLASSSQPLFAFQWENPTTGAKEQFTWTRLPQGFKNSPTLFSGVLAADLSKFSGQDMGCVLLQYIDDLLLASSTRTQCWEGTQILLRLKQVTWCPKGRLKSPLYEALKGEEKAAINWGPEQEKSSATIKTKLIEVLALGIPDVTRDFNLFIHENNGVALGVLFQEALATKALLVKEADKLTLGQNLNVKVPYAVVTLMEAKGQHWLTHAQMTQYQGLLCENPRMRLEAVRTLNPATFLPITEGTPEHDCLEVLEEVYSSWPDLTDRSLQNPDLVLFMGGSSFLDEGKR